VGSIAWLGHPGLQAFLAEHGSKGQHTRYQARKVCRRCIIIRMYS